MLKKNVLEYLLTLAFGRQSAKNHLIEQAKNFTKSVLCGPLEIVDLFSYLFVKSKKNSVFHDLLKKLKLPIIEKEGTSKTRG